MESSVFQFHPALQPKRDSRTSTPRGLVVVPAPDSDEPAAPSETVAIDAPTLSSTARKYQIDDDAAVQQAIEQYGLATGLPSARASDASSPRNSVNNGEKLQPRGAATNAGAPGFSRRTIRGSLHYLRHESILLTKKIVRSSRHLYRQLSLQQLLAYLLVLFGLLSESFTPAPRYNVPIGIVLFMASANGGFAFELDHRVVVAGLCVTTLLDLMWLMRPQEGAFNGFLRVQMENATHLCLVMCLAIKLWLIFATYFDLGPEVDETTAPPSPLSPEAAAKQGLQQSVWSRARFLFPRKTLPRRTHLSYEVLMRVLGLVWIHGVCGMLLLVLGLIAIMGLSGKAVFRSAKLGLPLPLAMLFKSASTLLCYVLATHHMSYHACLTVSGCNRLAKYYEASASDVVLKYNAKWMRRVRHAKVVDALLGVYLIAVYYSSVHATTFIAGETVLAVLVLTAAIFVVLDVWTPLLILVVARCGTVLHRHHREGTIGVDPYYPNQLEWDDEDEDENKKSKKSKTSAASSSSSSSSSSGESSSEDEHSSSSGDSTDARRRRRHVSQRQLRTQSSSHRPLMTTPLKRASSMLIIDASDLADREDLVSGSTPYWVRYWDDTSGRAYLVHGLTKETVWEIRGPTATARLRSQTPRGSGSADADERIVSSPRSGRPTNRDMTASSPALRTLSPRPSLPTASSFPPTTSSRLSPRRAPGSARASSHPTSESDVIVSTPLVLSPMPQRSTYSSGRSTGRRVSSALLSADDFLLLWDALADGGNFTCRVSKVPNVEELRHHLHTHGFSVASDGLNVASLRTIHFYAIVSAASDVLDTSATGRERRLSLNHNTSVAFFLGEFIFDSLSLKLYAKFRCPEADAIVPFVKKLQLKEIVGAYAPCE